MAAAGYSLLPCLSSFSHGTLKEIDDNLSIPNLRKSNVCDNFKGMSPIRHPLCRWLIRIIKPDELLNKNIIDMLFTGCITADAAVREAGGNEKLPASTLPSINERFKDREGVNP